MKPPTCYIGNCGSPSEFYIKWGTSDYQAAALCEQCKSDLWENIQPQIAATICFWIQISIEEFLDSH